MQNPANELRGCVIAKFGTIGKFAEAINWSFRKASYILSGRQVMTVKDVKECAEVLSIDNADDFLRIFYPMQSIKWTRKGA